MEGIDLAGVVDSDFQGIQINFAPPRPAGFANFCRRGGVKTCFFAGRGSPFPRGGAHIPDIQKSDNFILRVFFSANIFLNLQNCFFIYKEIGNKLTLKDNVNVSLRKH